MDGLWLIFPGNIQHTARANIHPPRVMHGRIDERGVPERRLEPLVPRHKEEVEYVLVVCMLRDAFPRSRVISCWSRVLIRKDLLWAYDAVETDH
jgi:hypothetical protein